MNAWMTISAWAIRPHFASHFPADATPQFLKKLTPPPPVYPVSCSYSLVSPICFLHSAHLYCCDDNPVSGQILKLYVVTDTCQEKRHERQYTLNIINLKPLSISNLGKFLRWFFITGKRWPNLEDVRHTYQNNCWIRLSNDLKNLSR